MRTRDLLPGSHRPKPRMQRRREWGDRASSLLRGSLLVCLLALLPAFLPAESEEPTNSRTLVRIGVVSSLFRDVPEPLAQAMLRPMKSLIETQTGLQGDVTRAGDAFELGQKLSEDKIQLGVFHGFEFAWYRLKFPKLQPLVIAVNSALR